MSWPDDEDVDIEVGAGIWFLLLGLFVLLVLLATVFATI